MRSLVGLGLIPKRRASTTDTCPYRTLRAARPTDRPVAVPEGKSCPVSMTFTRGRQQDQRPLFTVTAVVWETGIFDRLTADTGRVSVTADFQSLELDKAPHRPGS